MRELKNHLSRYLGRVRDGEEVVVTDHGRPVARLVAIDASSDRLNDRLDLLSPLGMRDPEHSDIGHRRVLTENGLDLRRIDV